VNIILRRSLTGVAESPWTGWPDVHGISGRIVVDWVAECAWNQWPNDRGIRTVMWKSEHCFLCQLCPHFMLRFKFIHSFAQLSYFVDYFSSYKAAASVRRPAIFLRREAGANTSMPAPCDINHHVISHESATVAVSLIWSPRRFNF